MADVPKDSRRGRQYSHIPLSLAAALAFRRARGNDDGLDAGGVSDDVLDVTAAALSRLVAIYAIDSQTGQPVRVEVDLGAGRFSEGATVYRRRNGNAVKPLFVQREQLVGAMELLKTTGIRLYFDGSR
jgi:hypothetical protein